MKPVEMLLAELQKSAVPGPCAEGQVLSWIEQEASGDLVRDEVWVYLWCRRHLKESPLGYLVCISFPIALILTLAGIDRYFAGLFM